MITGKENLFYGLGVVYSRPETWPFNIGINTNYKEPLITFNVSSGWGNGPNRYGPFPLGITGK